MKLKNHRKIHLVQVEAGRLDLLKRICPDVVATNRRRVQYAIDYLLKSADPSFDPAIPYALLGDAETGAKPLEYSLAEAFEGEPFKEASGKVAV